MKSVESIGFEAGGIDFTIYQSSNIIIDSGTSLFYLNDDLFSALYTQFFQGCNVTDKYLSCACGSYISPVFAIYLQGIKVYIYPKNYTTQFLGICRLEFGMSKNNYILLGDTFFRNYIITFDKQNAQIGFSGNYRLVSVIGVNSQTYLQRGQIAMASICALLSIVVIALLCLMWGSSKERRRDRETELRSYLFD